MKCIYCNRDTELIVSSVWSIIFLILGVQIKLRGCSFSARGCIILNFLSKLGSFANGTLENPVFSRVFSIRWKFFRFYFLCFCQFFEPILCSFSPVNIRIKNLQTPREIRLFKACIFFAALERFPSDKKSPNFKTPGCGQPHQKSCVVFTG